PTLVGGAQGPGRAEGMEAGGPQRLVGVDVADAGDERLVEEERFQAALPATDQAAEGGNGERVGQRLGSGRRERIVTRPEIEPDPAELADVAEPDLTTVLELDR